MAQLRVFAECGSDVGGRFRGLAALQEDDHQSGVAPGVAPQFVQEDLVAFSRRHGSEQVRFRLSGLAAARLAERADGEFLFPRGLPQEGFLRRQVTQKRLQVARAPEVRRHPVTITAEVNTRPGTQEVQIPVQGSPGERPRQIGLGVAVIPGSSFPPGPLTQPIYPDLPRQHKITPRLRQPQTAHRNQ